MSSSSDQIALDAQTIAAVVADVAGAKARGWTVEDFKRYFAAKGLPPGAYTDAINGRPVDRTTHGALVATSIHGLPDKPGDAFDDPYPDLPAAMKSARRWLLWRYEPNDDPTKKPRKVPVYANGERRQGVLDGPEDVARLVTYSEAVAALTPAHAGLGFALGPDGDGHWQGIDLDSLAEHPGLQFVADDLPGYTEKSPSGAGVHAIGYGRRFHSLGSNTTGIEAYSHGRYFTVTGESTGQGEICDIADFVEARLAPLHSPRPQDTSAAAPSPSGSLTGALAARDLRSALASMRSDDRDLWVRMGHALKPLGDIGRGLWLEWSQTSDKYDPADAARVWDSFQPSHTDHRAVFAEAQRQGWANPGKGVGQDDLPRHDPETGEILEDDASTPIIQATPYQWVPASQIPPRDILYGRHLFRKFLSATVAPGGVGKSSLEIVETLAMVTGRTLIGEAPKRPLSVWYWNGEDPLEELQRRIAASCLHYRIGPEDIDGRLYVDSGRTLEIIVVTEDRDGAKIATPVVDALVAEVKARGIDVLIIDPFVACHAVSENDNSKIELVVKQWMRVAEEGGCAIELVHHVRKPAGGVQETTVDDARGAGALLAKVRSARVLNGMSMADAAEVGIEAHERWAYFRVDNGKANLMPRGGDAKWRKMVGVALGNRVDVMEDNVGVATEWVKPDAFRGVGERGLMAVRAAVAVGEWREDIRASNWVGVAVAGALGIDLDEVQAKARVKTMIKTWVQNGVLEVVQGFDQARRPKNFVVVGKDKE